MVCKYTQTKQTNSALLGGTLELPQRCFAADIEEGDGALLAACDQQAPVVSVGGTVRRMPEARERPDGLLGVTPVDVDLAKQEGHRCGSGKTGGYYIFRCDTG